MRRADRDRLTGDKLLWAVSTPIMYILPWDDIFVPTQAVLEFMSNVAIELYYAPGYDSYARKGKIVWLST